MALNYPRKRAKTPKGKKHNHFSLMKTVRLSKLDDSDNFTSVTVKTRKPEGSTGSYFMVWMIFVGSYDKNRGDKIAKSRSRGRPSDK